jgi:hypothetical protein
MRAFLIGELDLDGDLKEMIDIEGKIEDAPPDLLWDFLGHRRDLAAWLMGARGDERKAVVATERERRRVDWAPLFQAVGQPGGPTDDAAALGGFPASKEK